MGYDAWHQNEKLVLPLQQLPPDEACPQSCTRHAVEPSYDYDPHKQVSLCTPWSHHVST